MRTKILAGIALASASLVPAVQAQFLVDPSCGTVLSTVNDDDRSYNGRSLGFTASYFGQAISTVDVSSNGFLSFTGNADTGNTGLPTSTQRLCAMWDDLYVYGGQAITERVEPGVYYSATWQVGTYQFGHVVQAAQIVWFGANTRMYGFDFQPNDIVMCYKSVGASPWNATIGIEGPAGRVAVLPGTTNGFISDASSSLLPNFTNSVKWILYRPNAVGNYDVTIVPCVADVDDGSSTGTRDGGITIDDLLYFLERFGGGC